MEERGIVDMYSNIDIYNNSSIILERRMPNRMISWIMVLILFSIFLVIISFIPINIFKTYNGYVTLENNNQYINLVMNSNNLIDKKGILYVKNKSINYEFNSIKENIITVLIDSKYLLVPNELIKINLLYDKTTLLKLIRNKILKGFGS